MRHRSLFVALLALMGTFAVARGDVSLSLKAEHGTYVQYEPVNIFLTIINDKADPLVVDDISDSSWRLRFEVSRRRDEFLSRLSSDPMMRPTRIPGDDNRKIMVELGRFYSLREMGTYSVQAVLESSRQVFRSNVVLVDVVRGFDMLSVRRRSPGNAGRYREYSLRYWPREGKEQLFLCVKDEDPEVRFGTIVMGRLVRVSSPELDADHFGNVFIYHQSGPDMITRSYVDSTRDHIMLVDQKYYHMDGRPYLDKPPKPPPKPEPKKPWWKRMFSRSKRSAETDNVSEPVEE